MFGRLKNWLSGQHKANSSRCTPATQDYLRKIQKLVRDCYPVLTRPEVLEIEHLIDHSELAEALLTLARIIDEKKAVVPRSTINRIRELIDGFAEAEFLPENLDDCAPEKK
jgi:hypothetical protein